MQRKEAMFYRREEAGMLRCTLCPRNCRIAPGECGYCGVRRNSDGRLEALTWCRPVAVQIDPIEKKPLAYFLPGSRTFSLGTFGCNLGCVFCQNDELSRGSYPPGFREREVAPEEIVEAALRHGCRSVAFTYNEPTVFFEYAREIARLAKQANLATVLVSNGWINPEPMRELYPLIDAANIDMKGFSENFYRELCGGSLAPVLRSMEYFGRELGRHLEITNLVIPGRNDSPEMIGAFLDWLEETLGREQPIHFTAFHPACRLFDPPTPPARLREIRDLARGRGFTRIRLGNIPDPEA